MNNDLGNLSDREEIKSENEFLKMKMMLENGAHFGSVDNPDFSPELENQFLKNVIAFEKQFDEHKLIKVYDKIDRPTIFKPVAEIPDEQIEAELDALLAWLSEYNICISVISPNITLRELYRFIKDELFEYEMDDMDLPGWTSNFTYDEFHPDPIYENETAAIEDCLKIILKKDPVDWLPFFKSENIRLNDHYPITEQELKLYINHFKEAYDAIECTEISEVKCIVNGSTSTVTGNCVIKLTCSDDEQVLNGKWLVAFETTDNFYWYINHVQIKGINI